MAIKYADYHCGLNKGFDSKFPKDYWLLWKLPKES